jgi:hypothetical protein
MPERYWASVLRSERKLDRTVAERTNHRRTPRHQAADIGVVAEEKYRAPVCLRWTPKDVSRGRRRGVHQAPAARG